MGGVLRPFTQKINQKRPPNSSAKRAKCDDFSIDISLRQEVGLANDARSKNKVVETAPPSPHNEFWHPSR